HLVISEIMTGESGNNNLDFIELYNPTQELVDLQGYSLWYQLKKDQEDVLIYTWETSAFVPPYGHFLLLRLNQNIGLEVDAYFDYSLVPQRGSLALRSRSEGIVDQVAWGDTDAIFVETNNAPAIQNGSSLERLPGGDAGNGDDSGNNANDFIINKNPNPQTSASLATPRIENELELTINAPDTSEPGSVLIYEGTVTNLSDKKLDDVTLHIPVIKDLVLINSSVAFEKNNNQIDFLLGDLDPSSSTYFDISFETAWKYTTISIPGIYADASNINSPIVSGPLRTVIQGGSVPIGIARDLLNNEGVIIEGTATMYTGGFYAGSGVKFYLEDNSGGIQVYVPGGSGTVDVPLGAYVRVEGIPQPYRGAIEIIPSPEDVSVIQQPVDPFAWEPRTMTIIELKTSSEVFAGELVTMSGEVQRVEEFSFSYEMDLVQDGNILEVYIDKLTEINVEAIETGQYFQISGILENVDDSIQLYPRVQSDLVEIQPPTVTMMVHMPINYNPSEEFEIEVLINNHLSENIESLNLSLQVPEGFSVNQISDNGDLINGNTTWNLDTLPGDGAEKTFSLSGTIANDIEFLFLENYQLIYETQEEVLVGNPTYSFPGDSVPVWAIQGRTTRSPYLLEYVKTNGVVTGVFPELEGFFIQGEPDQDELTSNGLFIYTDVVDPTIAVGDFIIVNGTIREPHSETQLFLEGWEIIENNQALPDAISLNPPIDENDSMAYYEALEGMLVQIEGPARAVSPTNKYGETALVLPLYSGTHLMHGEENGFAIRVDDGSFVTHTDQSTMPYAAATGDLFSNVSGPLSYTYGYYKIQPLSTPIIEKQPTIIDALPTTATNEFRVMTWNVENLFDFLEPHPSTPGLPTVAEYRVWLEKIANTILMADYPAVIGLQEVEHVGVLEDIAEHQLLQEFDYQAVLLEGTDSRGIDVGYLVRGDVQVLDVQQFPAPNELTPRPPLLVTVQINLGSKTRIVHILNNHFLSMSGGEQATEPRRIAQAAWNGDLVKQIVANDPDAFVIVMGDLNSYYNSPPIDTLRSIGMVHSFDQLAHEERYTYIYQGVAQVLDHILVIDKYESNISSVDILHVNADFPLQMPGDSSVLHKSDHDPVVVTFR
ncbi:MAG TPA: lamin tail domain-containing protein, partial [Anaerolineaceae bacterium]|nr:lamin tail domain-containing protein [Anaerolineaceae bacterium]